MLSRPLALIIASVVTLVWLGNFLAQFVFPGYESDPLIHGVFMTIIGLLFGLQRPNSSNGGTGGEGNGGSSGGLAANVIAAAQVLFGGQPGQHRPQRQPRDGPPDAGGGGG